MLVEPEIPQNTGNIGRLCLATGCKLNLVGKLGFDIDEKTVRRAGLDYWKHINVSHSENTGESLEILKKGSKAVHLFSKYGSKCFWDVDYKQGDTLVFGSETRGLPEQWIENYAESVYNLPLFDERVRSLNLSNAVSVVVYEGIRQISKR